MNSEKMELEAASGSTTRLDVQLREITNDVLVTEQQLLCMIKRGQLTNIKDIFNQTY
jgi:hypothetical protein